MNKKIFIILLVFLFLAISLLIYFFNIITIDVKKLEKANIKIVNLTSGFNGSGTHIKLNKKSYILTSAHLFSKSEACKDIIIVIANDKMRYNNLASGSEIKLVFIDRVSDLALIEVRKEWNYPFLTIAKSEPNREDPIWVVGNPIILNDIITFGRVKDKKDSIYILSAKIFFGSSGGAVVDKRNRLVGVTRSMFWGLSYLTQLSKSKSAIISYSECISLPTIKKFLQEYISKREEK